ncbi:hypothetical protein BGW42_008421 [Actinomortierella wolfii]|nr:hypothetical protein BGW42_008421 [Actinomortierella wolfii]
MSAAVTRQLFFTVPLLVLLLLAAGSALGSPTDSTIILNSKSNREARANVGQMIEVKLENGADGGVSWTFGEPKSSNEKIVAPFDDVGGGGHNGSPSVLFTAADEGTADITAEVTCTPPGSEKCPSNPWKVTIVVKPDPSA